MAAYLVDRGVPRSAILVDPQGNKTCLTARNTRALAEEDGLISIILVSHFYHLPRAHDLPLPRPANCCHRPQRPLRPV